MKVEYKITDRTFSFAVRVVKMARFMELETSVPKVLINQVLKAGTSIGANVEEAQAAQSKADFIAKMSIARKEARESNYWLRLFIASELLTNAQLGNMLEESEEIVKILTTIVKKAQTNT